MDNYITIGINNNYVLLIMHTVCKCKFTMHWISNHSNFHKAVEA